MLYSMRIQIIILISLQKKKKHSLSHKMVIEINNVVKNPVSVQNQVIEHPHDERNEVHIIIVKI